MEVVQIDFLPQPAIEAFELAERMLSTKWLNHCPEVVYVPKEEVGDDDDPWGFDISAFAKDVEAPDLTEDDPWGSDLFEPEEVPVDPEPESTEVPEVYFWLHAFVLDDPTTDQLGKLGVWDEKDQIVIVPKTLLEDAGIVSQTGDRLVIGARNFTIDDVLRWGYWEESDRYLLVVFNCTELKDGSQTESA